MCTQNKEPNFPDLVVVRKASSMSGSANESSSFWIQWLQQSCESDWKTSGELGTGGTAKPIALQNNYIKVIIIQGIICTKLCRQVSGSWFTEIEHASNSYTHCNCNSLVPHYVRAYSDPIINQNLYVSPFLGMYPWYWKYSVHTHLFYSLKFHDIVYTHW